MKKRKMKVSEIMNKPHFIEEDIKVKDAAKIMSEKNVESLILLKSGEIEGIITEKDISNNLDKINKKITEIMSSPVITINSDQDIDKTAAKMGKNNIKRLPVLDGEGKLIGIVTSSDLIKHSEDLNEEFFFQ